MLIFFWLKSRSQGVTVRAASDAETCHPVLPQVRGSKLHQLKETFVMDTRAKCETNQAGELAVIH